MSGQSRIGVVTPTGFEFDLAELADVRLNMPGGIGVTRGLAWVEIDPFGTDSGGSGADAYGGIGPAYVHVSTDGTKGAGLTALGLAGIEKGFTSGGVHYTQIALLGQPVDRNLSIPLETEERVVHSPGGGDLSTEVVTKSAEFDVDWKQVGTETVPRNGVQGMMWGRETTVPVYELEITPTNEQAEKLTEQSRNGSPAEGGDPYGSSTAQEAEQTGAGLIAQGEHAAGQGHTSRGIGIGIGGPVWSFEGTPTPEHTYINLREADSDGGAHFAGDAHVDQTDVPAKDGNDRPQGNRTGDYVPNYASAKLDLSGLDGGHAAGHAHTSTGTHIPDDGNARPQGNRTNEPGTPDGQEAELEPGQGEHPAGSAHHSDALTGGVADAAAAGGAAALGDLLADAVDPDGLLETATWSTFQQNLKETIGGSGGFGNATEDFGASLQSTAAAMVAGELSGELIESLGFDGSSLGDQLGARLSAQAASIGANAGGHALGGGLDAGAASFNQSFTASNFSNAGAGVVGAYAASELGLGAETEAGATMATVGSTIGTYVGSVLGPLGAAVGSFIGSALGSAIGDLFGSDAEPPPPPEAEATLTVDETAHFSVSAANDAHGGNAGGMAVAAQRAADTLNTLVETTGGRILEPGVLDDLEIGYDGKGVYAGGGRFDTVADAVAHLVETSLADTAIEGGDVHVKRALYRQLEDGYDPAEMRDALATAERYGQIREQQARIDALAAEPAVDQQVARHRAGVLSKSELSDAAAIVLDAREVAGRAEALGLDQPHRFDHASRLNEAFEAQGINFEGVAATDLVIANVHGELVVAVTDADRPDTSIRDLPHATVDADAGDFGAAMLYLPDGGWRLQDLLDLADVRPGGGAVHVGDALRDQHVEGHEALRMGTADADVIEGGAQDEILIGWQGADVLRGGAGDDRMVGGTGCDRLKGGAGEDAADYRGSAAGVAVDLATGQGRGGAAQGDLLTDIEHLDGSAHDDRLQGDAFANALHGQGGDDILSGRGGDDALYGEAGDDALGGGAGSDRLAGHAGDDALAGGAGADRLAGGEGDDRMAGGASSDFLMGGSGDDLLGGGEGRDAVAGGAGDDVIRGHGDGDTLAGGEGADTVVYEHAMADYRIELVDGELRIAGPASEGGGDRLNGIETLQFDERVASVERMKEYLTVLDEADNEERERRVNGVAASGATALGDAAAIGLVAAFAAPSIAAQQEVAAYRPDHDASLGSDGFGANTSSPPVDEGAPEPVDDIEQPAGAPAQAAREGTLERRADPAVSAPPAGQAGAGEVPPGPADYASVAQRDARVNPSITPKPAEDGSAAEDADGEARLAAESDDGLEERHYLRGTSGNDVLVDEVGLNDIYAGTGNDRIAGLDGDDRIDAGPGNDVIQPGAGTDRVFGGEGVDLVGYRDAATGVRVDLLRGVGAGGIAMGDVYDGVEAIAGSLHADWLRAAANTTGLYGLDGDDELFGGAADDIIRGGRGADLLMGGAGDDELFGGAGADIHAGGAGDDLLIVGDDHDFGSVSGGTGTDTVRLAGAFDGAVDPSRLDGVEIAQGSTDDDEWIGAYDLERIDSGGGHDVVSFTEGVHDVELEWPDPYVSVRVAHSASGSVEVDAEEIRFSDRTLYLDGRGNAPIVAGETLSGTEDAARHFTAADLIANDFDIDPGDTTRLQSVAGIDIELTRALDAGYWEGAGPRETAVFSGKRDEYTVNPDGDRLIVERVDGVADGADTLHGIQTLRFANTDVYLGEADARRGTVEVRSDDFVFRPSTNYNNLSGGTAAGFAYTVADDDGQARSATTSVDLTPVNDVPYLGPGEVDYDGKIDERSYVTGSHPHPKTGNEIAKRSYYPAVEADGRILGRDIEDGGNLTYALVRGPEHGRVDLHPDGTFEYRLNIGEDAASTRIWEETVCYVGRAGGCETITHYDVTPPADQIGYDEAQYQSFTVGITDHGESPGLEDDVSVTKTISIENDPPSGGGGKKPLALDLDDDGLEFRDIDDSDIVADMNGDGMLDRMAWIGQDDGLLTIDRDGDDRVSGFDEVRFVDDHPDARTDLEGLRLAWDSNDDGVLDAADSRWADFGLWQDADGDGVDDPRERRSLTEAGIESIDLSGDGALRQDGDVTVFGETTYTGNDGTQHTAGDVAFAFAPTGTAAEAGTRTTGLPASPQDCAEADATAAIEPSAPSDRMTMDGTLAMTADEIANMLALKIVQHQAMAAPSAETSDVPVMFDDLTHIGSMSDVDEHDLSTIAG